MFLSEGVILYAFKGLKKIFPQDEGKSRSERVSGLRVFLAAAKVIHSSGSDRIDLRPDSSQRKDLIEAVGEVVRLDGEGTYTQDFAERTRNAPDYNLGSNLLTTRVAITRGGESEYPKRPKPVLKLEDEVATISPDATSNLHSAYNLDLIKNELAVWLVRFESLPIAKADSDETVVSDAIASKVRELYGDSIASILKVNDAGFSSYLASCPKPLLTNAPPSLSDLREGKSGAKSEADENSISSLGASDPYLVSVQDAINRRGEANFLFFGTPGTGKTWYAAEIAKFLSKGNPERVKLLQFHPSVSYDDFVEGFVPKVDGGTKGIVYEIEKKHFVRFAEIAAEDSENLYILIIDEISRGDPARVFGELLTYIETSYRSREFSLIYSGEKFSVPENLIIFATANPYDRSVGELDDAFLRRFFMIEFESDNALLKQRLLKNSMTEADCQKVVHFFDTMHENLPFGFGHAQLFNVFTLDDLRLLWRSKLKFVTKRALQFEPEKYDAIEGKYSELFELAANEQTDAAGQTSAQPQLEE